MKSLLLTLTSLFVVGCGGGSSDSDSDNTTEYDLSKYLVPVTSQTHVYRTAKYEKDNGEQEYTHLETTYTNETYDVNGTIIKVSDGETYEINDDNITIIDSEDNETYDMPKIVKIGDILMKYTTTKIEDGIEVDVDNECKLSNQLDEKVIETEPYNDVLLVDCTESKSGDGTLGGIDFSISASETMQYYFAKEIGLISSLEESCEDVTLGSNTSSSCEKEESELITIVQ